MGIAFNIHFWASQFRTLPSPDYSFKGQTIIVTGANTGLGFDAAQHFVRLGAAKVILACRSQARGDAAVAAIEKETGIRGVAEVWLLDMSQYDSIKAFAKRAEGLPRLDKVVLNAGVNMPERQACGDSEMVMTVNVYGTFLLLGLLLPTLQRPVAGRAGPATATVVTSEVHHWVPFRAEAARDDIFAWLDDARSFDGLGRYAATKLLQVHGVRALAPRLGGGGVVVNMVNPGLCKTEFGRHFEGTGVGAAVFAVMASLLGRTSEVGSRTLVYASQAGVESHGGYSADCEMNE